MSNILSEVHPELVAEWSDKNLPLTPDRITYGSNKVVWWKGACGHEWQTSVKARSNGENCPICSGARVIEGVNDLATLKPELADEWSSKNDPLKPTMVTTGSHKKVIWRDKYGHELSAMVVIEMAVLVGCAKYWFPSYVFDLTEILKTAGFQIIVTLPTVMLMLVIASACKNMWVSLGIGVILVFTLSILPQDNIVLSLFPFASPYQMLSAAVENSRTALFLAVCGIETVVFGIAEVLYLQVRRCFE